MTSSTSPASTPARAKAARNAMAPRDCAERVLSAPLKLPTGVRAAETLTMSFMLEHSRKAGHPARVGVVAARRAGRKSGGNWACSDGTDRWPEPAYLHIRCTIAYRRRAKTV